MKKSGDIYEELSAEWNQLQSAWQDSRAVWHDDAALQFDKRFMSPLENEIPDFLFTLETLKDELQDAWRELY